MKPGDGEPSGVVPTLLSAVVIQDFDIEVAYFLVVADSICL